MKPYMHEIGNGVTSIIGTLVNHVPRHRTNYTSNTEVHIS